MSSQMQFWNCITLLAVCTQRLKSIGIRPYLGAPAGWIAALAWFRKIMLTWIVRTKVEIHRTVSMALPTKYFYQLLDLADNMTTSCSHPIDYCQFCECLYNVHWFPMRRLHIYEDFCGGRKRREGDELNGVNTELIQQHFRRPKLIFAE